MIAFTYGGLHTVDEVSESDYKSCTTGNSISSDSSGATTITLKTAGKHYFICATPGHCSQGMKLAVTVQAGKKAPAPTPEAAPPSSTTPTTPSDATPPTTTTPTSTSPSTTTPTTTSTTATKSATTTHSPSIAILLSMMAVALLKQVLS